MAKCLRHSFFWIAAPFLILAIQPRAVAAKLYALDFSPYYGTQDPNRGAQVDSTQIRARMAIVAPYTTWIRTYGMTEGLENAPAIARQLGLKVAAGAWISSNTSANDTEIANLIAAMKAGNVDIAIVGSEAVLRGDVTVSQLLAYMNQVKQAAPPGVQVATADTYGIFLQNPSLISASDIVMANFFPYWEGTSINNATCSVDQQYRRLASLAGGKTVAVSETGWPSGGSANGAAIPSPTNAARYGVEMISWATLNDVPLYYFEALDEPWKATYEGPQGAYWGIWDTNGVLKPGMNALLSGQTSPSACGGVLPGNPGLSATFVPVVGSSLQLELQASGVRPQDYVVATYINVSGSFWTKPYFAQPTVPLNQDGSARIPIVTGGYDALATEIDAFLIPANIAPPVVGPGSLPSIPFAIASFRAVRTAPSIFGRVTDSHGTPIAGATISGAILGQTTTAPDGYYSFYNITSTGTINLTASHGGYTFPSSPVIASITPTGQEIDFVSAAQALLTQNIDFVQPPNIAAGNSLTLSATASSGLLVAFASATPTVCAVSEIVVNTLTAGTCTISASQPGNSSYAAAVSVTRSFTVLATQSISFPRLNDTVYGAAPVQVSASASSGLPVVIASLTPSVCTVSKSTVAIIAAGTCSLTASQLGDERVAAAAPVTQSFSAARASQSIMFAPPADLTVGDPPARLSASATSSLPVALGSNTQAICTISGILVTAISPGNCSILASQSGDENYAPAVTVARSFVVHSAIPSPSIRDAGVVPIYGKAATISPGSWCSIYGENLSAATFTWIGNFPTTLGGASVFVNGKAAYLWYVSPTQINFQAPDDAARGTVTVEVRNAGGSASTTVTLSAFSPSLIMADTRYAVGVIPTSDGSGAYGQGAYDLLAPHGSSTGRPAHPGETILLYGVGFGPTQSAVPAGQSFQGAAWASSEITISVGYVPAKVLFAGIVSPGLFQFNVVVPNTGSGDQLVSAMVAGLATSDGVYIPVQ